MAGAQPGIGPAERIGMRDARDRRCESKFSDCPGVLASGHEPPFRYFNGSPEVIRLVVMMYVQYFEVGEGNGSQPGEKPPTGLPDDAVEVGRRPRRSSRRAAGAGRGLLPSRRMYLAFSGQHLAELATAGLLGASTAPGLISAIRRLTGDAGARVVILYGRRSRVARGGLRGDDDRPRSGSGAADRRACDPANHGADRSADNCARHCAASRASQGSVAVGEGEGGQGGDYES
jgi:hypothetical protein